MKTFRVPLPVDAAVEELVVPRWVATTAVPAESRWAFLIEAPLPVLRNPRQVLALVFDVVTVRAPVMDIADRRGLTDIARASVRIPSEHHEERSRQDEILHIIISHT